MPYASNDELPKQVKTLPSAAQTLFRRVYNTTAKGHPDYSEEKLFKIAWGAVKNAGYTKDDSGQWVKQSIELSAYPIDISWKDNTITFEAELLDVDVDGLSLNVDNFVTASGIILSGIRHDEEKYIFSFVVTDEIVRRLFLSEHISSIPVSILFNNNDSE